MQNPIDLLGVHPTGANTRPVDGRDYPSDSPELGGASAPFDWNKGYDVEEDIGLVLPTKDQMQSSSCGGQTVGEYGQALTQAYLGDPSEKSAKATYCQVYAPGGGSNSRMLGEVYVKQGVYRESLVPSYPSGGGAVTEAFMERPQDITAAARQDASRTAGLLAYSFPRIDIDTIAAAIRDSKGILIGIHGSNNGTWLTGHPSAAKQGDYWAHFMYGGKARLEHGKKTLRLKQSWGKDVAPADNAWQAITEDHFNAGQIWDAMIFHYAPLPAKTGHAFNVDLKYGQTSEEITQAQIVLAHEGVFNLAPTGYYGPITARAVLKFRAKHGIPSTTDTLGHSMGPKTRAVLNVLSQTNNPTI